jgi:hypothetical protein
VQDAAVGTTIISTFFSRQRQRQQWKEVAEEDKSPKEETWKGEETLQEEEQQEEERQEDLEVAFDE